MDTPTLVAALGFLAFTGWNLYLTTRFQAQKEAQVALDTSTNARLTALSARTEELRNEANHRWETVLKEYATKVDHSVLRDETSEALKAINGKLDKIMTSKWFQAQQP